MRVRVLLFAVARQAAGSGAVEVELPEPATVADLQAALAVQCPPLEPVLGQCAVAIGHRYAAPSQAVTPGIEVALIPPVSGG